MTSTQLSARIGYRVLKQGRTALAAVVTAVVSQEDNPLFNAGLGLALDLHGEVETDASLVCG